MTLTEVVFAVGLFGVVIGTILTGLMQANYRAAWATYSDAATKLAEQRMEQVMTARWEPTAVPPIDQLVSANFPDDTVNLDVLTADGTALTGARSVQITPVTSGGVTQYKVITVRVVWSYRGNGPFTNDVTTIRSTDQ